MMVSPETQSERAICGVSSVLSESRASDSPRALPTATTRSSSSLGARTSMESPSSSNVSATARGRAGGSAAAESPVSPEVVGGAPAAPSAVSSPSGIASPSTRSAGSVRASPPACSDGPVAASAAASSAGASPAASAVVSAGVSPAAATMTAESPPRMSTSPAGSGGAGSGGRSFMATMRYSTPSRINTRISGAVRSISLPESAASPRAATWLPSMSRSTASPLSTYSAPYPKTRGAVPRRKSLPAASRYSMESASARNSSL